jgi:hypothetical protein
VARFGYTLMTEQSGPKDLVRYAIAAEQVGFDFEVSSDHYSPWLVSQGHAPYARRRTPRPGQRLRRPEVRGGRPGAAGGTAALPSAADVLADLTATVPA